MRAVPSLALVALAGLGAACGSGFDDEERPAEARPADEAGPAYRPVGLDAEPLRSTFEDDRGKVRAIFLVSPT